MSESLTPGDENLESPFLKKYEDLPPRERNNVYRQLWNLIPDETDKDGETRRATNVVFVTLLQRMQALLTFAQITEIFKEEIFSDFERLIIQGEEPDIVVFLTETCINKKWTVDEELPESPGIFDKTRAAQIEQKAYQIERASSPRDYEHGRKIALSLGIDPEIGNLVADKARNFFTKWRQDYIDHYYDEP